MQGGAVWLSFDGRYQDHRLLFVLGGGGVRLSHKDADLAPVLMFTNSKSLTEFNFHLGSIPLLVHHLRPFRTYSSPSLCDYVFSVMTRYQFLDQFTKHKQCVEIWNKFRPDYIGLDVGCIRWGNGWLSHTKTWPFAGQNSHSRRMQESSTNAVLFLSSVIQNLCPETCTRMKYVF